MKIMSYTRKKEKQEQGRWEGLLPELLELISNLLPILDLLNFRSVCRRWRSSPSGRSPITKFSKNTPWLIIYDYNNNNKNFSSCNCFLYHPSHPQSCTFQVPSLQGATCIVSKHGWLLAHYNGCLFLCNPFSLSTIHLPKHPGVNVTTPVCTFAFQPTSLDCTIFIVTMKDSSTMEISSCRPQVDSEWRIIALSLNGALLGTIRAVQCCNCDNGKGCSCLHKNRLYAYDWAGKCLSYNFIDERWCVLQYKNLKANSLLEEMVEFHYEELKQRFGEDGFGISTCQLSMNMDKSSGIGGCSFIVGGDEGKAEAEGIRVKAAWIEPRF